MSIITNPTETFTKIWQNVRPSSDRVARATLRTAGAGALGLATYNGIAAGALFGENNRLVGYMQAPNPSLDGARLLLDPTAGYFFPIFGEQAGLLNTVAAGNAIGSIGAAAIGVTILLIADRIGS